MKKIWTPRQQTIIAMVLLVLLFCTGAFIYAYLQSENSFNQYMANACLLAFCSVTFVAIILPIIKAFKNKR